MEFSNSFDISIAWDIKFFKPAYTEALIWFKLTKDKFGSIKSISLAAVPCHLSNASLKIAGELLT